MTFAEFEVAVKTTDIVLVPIGAIEQYSSHPPLATSKWCRSCSATTELPRTTHADGAETSWSLYFYTHVVRPGYERFPPITVVALSRGLILRRPSQESEQRFRGYLTQF